MFGLVEGILAHDKHIYACFLLFSTFVSVSQFEHFENLTGGDMVLILDRKLTNSCARKEQSLLFDLFKAFDKVESRQKSGPKRRIFLHACSTCSELPSNISTMTEKRESRSCSILQRQNFTFLSLCRSNYLCLLFFFFYLFFSNFFFSLSFFRSLSTSCLLSLSLQIYKLKKI